MYDSANGSMEVRINRLSYIDYTCWHIWKSRCDFQFNNQTIYPRRVIDAISHSVSAFKETISRPSTTSLPSPMSKEDGVHWSPPNQGAVNINVDACWVASDRRGFTGVVTRDEDGRFLAPYRHQVKATGVAMAEAMAIWHGCKLGVSKGWNSIIVASDSLESISFLRDLARKGSWDAFPILRKCSSLGMAFQECHWSWVPRLANSAANHLASRQCREVRDHIWVDRPPSSLVHVLCNDGLPCPP